MVELFAHLTFKSLKMILESKQAQKLLIAKLWGGHFKGKKLRSTRKEHLYSAKFFLQGILNNVHFHLTAAIKEKFSGRGNQMNRNVSLGQ